MAQNQKLKTFEFRVICADEEACKRVRFGMETGLYVKPAKSVPDFGVNFLGTPYSNLINNLRKSQIVKKFNECKHELPMDHYFEAIKDKKHSLEAPCPTCDTTLTIVSGKMVLEIRDASNTSTGTTKKEFPVLATVDFIHYDDYPRNNQKIKILIDDNGELSNLKHR
ncbi:MAG: hypothetical protein KGH53_03490 [Candidatus Micrarchaeota archaeon]|nr:hypothetical protein [Candidatus Micrarchaeota archaeon]